jgi:hypothetical protein
MLYRRHCAFSSYLSKGLSAMISATAINHFCHYCNNYTQFLSPNFLFFSKAGYRFGTILSAH